MTFSENLKTSKILIKARKSYSQNFLVDENIARKIIEAAQLTKNDIVIEIGPGQGALTKYIVGKVKKFYAVEIDKRVVDFLVEIFPKKDLIIINGDFLKLDVREIFRREQRKLKIIGNIPYNITSQILFKTFEDRDCIESCIFMVQKEVAQRIVASKNSKEYGILSVITQFYGSPEILFKVSPSCFFPKPKVTSAVIKLKFFQTLKYDVDEDFFKDIVKSAFGKRRKTLNNALKYSPFYDEISGKLKKFKSFSLNKRAEELSLEQFIELTSFLSKTNASTNE